MLSLAFLAVGLIVALYTAGCAGAAGTNGGANGGHLVTLDWNPATIQVTAYNVYRSEQPEGPYARVKTVTAPSHQFGDSSVQSGATYYYVVTSVGQDGMESEDSIQVIARVP